MQGVLLDQDLGREGWRYSEPRAWRYSHPLRGVDGAHVVTVVGPDAQRLLVRRPVCGFNHDPWDGHGGCGPGLHALARRAIDRHRNGESAGH